MSHIDGEIYVVYFQEVNFRKAFSFFLKYSWKSYFLYEREFLFASMIWGRPSIRLAPCWHEWRPHVPWWRFKLASQAFYVLKRHPISSSFHDLPKFIVMLPRFPTSLLCIQLIFHTVQHILNYVKIKWLRRPFYWGNAPYSKVCSHRFRWLSSWLWCLNYLFKRIN